MFDPAATSMRFATPWNHGDARSPHVPSQGPIDPHHWQQRGPRRRSKALMLPSSVLLVLGLFLPTLKVCNDPVAPIQFPMFWTPHVVAILVFAAVLVRPWRLRGLDIALRVVLGVTALGWGLVIVPSPAATDSSAAWLFSAALLALGALLLIPARSSESMVARCAVIGGVGSSLWFGAIATDNGALFGAYSSAIASVGMMLGGVWWWLEQQLDADRLAHVRPGRRSDAQRDGELGGYRRIG
jgi:hypothetical protein